MKLSILIPTLNEPESIKYLRRLRGILDPQVAKYPGEVEIKIHDAGRSMPTGTKRNELIANSDSDYFSMIDVDDIVSYNYVSQIMQAISYSPDVITMCGWITTDGHSRVNWVIKLGEKYEYRNGVYYRWPNHLAVYKRSLVQHIKFPDVWEREDYEWSIRVKNANVLKTEIHIKDQIYHYDFKTKKAPYRRHAR